MIIVIIIQGWYSKPTGVQCTKWTQSHHTPQIEIEANQIFVVLGVCVTHIYILNHLLSQYTFTVSCGELKMMWL
jgi:hypothetical protein